MPPDCTDRSMDGNKDDALRCLEKAREALRTSDTDKATRFLDKSVRMYPIPEEQGRVRSEISASIARKSSQRPAQTASDASSDGASASSSTKAKPSHEEESNDRPVTPAMRALVASVRKGAKESHYAVLGVNREVDEPGLRRAFKRRALGLHPDKNCAPGAEEAFKLVSKAFEILSDKDRRAHYDRYGVDDPADMASQAAYHPFAASAGGTRKRRRGGATMHFGQSRQRNGRPTTLEEELDDLMSSMNGEELFEYLFTAAAGGPHPGLNGHTGERRRAGTRPVRTVHVDASFKPVLLLGCLFFLMMMVFPSGPSHRYSLTPSGEHKVHRQTESGVDYYISPKSKLDSESQRYIQRFNDAVDEEALALYSDHCNAERNRRAQLLQQSRALFARQSTREKYAAKARNFDMPNCRTAQSLSARIQDTRQRRRHVAR